MSIIEEGNIVIEQRLLSDIESEVEEVLDFLDKHQEIVPQFILQLTIVNALHPTITIRKKVSKLLENVLSKGEIKMNKKNLDFLRLILEGDQEIDEEVLMNAYEKYEPFRELYEPIILKSDLYSRTYLEISNLFVDRKINHKIAQSLLEVFIAVNKEDENANILLSRIFQHKKQYDKSLVLLNKILELNPNSFQGQLEIGFVNEEFILNHDEAIKHYKLAAAINPDEIIVLVRLAYVYYFFLDNVEESKYYIDCILNIDPFNQYALTILGRICWEDQGKHTLALNTFLKGLNGSKFHHSFLLGTLAEFYMEALGNHELGKAFYEQALDSEPENKSYLINYMQLATKFYNDYGKMKHYYEQYLKHNDTDIDILMEYCLFILNYIHDIKLARKNLKKVLAIDSVHLIAKALYEEITD